MWSCSPGTPLDFRMKFGRSIPAEAKIIQMDLDETLIGENRSADVALAGNLGATFEEMLAVIDEQGVPLDYSGHSAALRAREDELEAGLRSVAEQRRGTDRPAAARQGDRRRGR